MLSAGTGMTSVNDRSHVHQNYRNLMDPNTFGMPGRNDHVKGQLDDQVMQVTDPVSTMTYGKIEHAFDNIHHSGTSHLRRFEDENDGVARAH